MRRRAFIASLGSTALAALPNRIGAQQRTEIPRIGFLSPAAPTVAWIQEGFREGLREFGYIAGQNVQIESRWAHGRSDRLPELASELVRLNVDVIVVMTTPGATAVKAATSTIPIVFVQVADPVGAGLVASLARPGGNLTGVSNVAADLVGKHLELLRDVDPELTRIAILWNPKNPSFQTLLRRAEEAAQASGVQSQVVEASAPNELDDAFAAMRAQGTRALLVLVDPLFTLHRQAIVQMLVRDRILAVSGMREFAEEGGLAAYGPSYRAAMKHTAVYVHKILKGAKPSDLPIEQPTKFELIINLKAAKTLGVTIPPTLVARADEVIE